MKNIKAYEFKDLPKKLQLKIWEEEVDSETQWNVETLFADQGMYEEEKFYEILGCSKHYAETTSWFVPSCYFEKHRGSILVMVKENLQRYLFTQYGRFIEAQ